jgi:hypothetical protein
MKKFIKLYEEFILEYVNQSLTVLNNIDQVPRTGKPMNREEFLEDGVPSLNWENVVFVRASDELPVFKNNQLVCHTGRALRSVGINKNFEDYLKKKYENEIKDEWTKNDPNYKDYETFKAWILKAHHGRWTKHFTLNHFVASHSSGDWSGNKFYYLMPATEMVKVNGKPASLFAIDTWYDKSIVVPDNSVILYTEKGEKELQEFLAEHPTCRNKVFFLKVDEKRDEFGKFPAAEEVVKKMGYTIVSGGSHYSEEDIDSEMRDLADKEKIRKTGLHWGSKWYDLEKGQVDWRNYSSIARLGMKDYYNLDTKHEEKEYLEHRGFSKEYIAECFKKAQEGEESSQNLMLILVDIARAIVTPKYAYHLFAPQGSGSLADTFIGKYKLDLLNWDVEKEKAILKAEEDKNRQTPEQQYGKYPAGNPTDYEANVRGKKIRAERASDSDTHVYLYFNKYLITDLVQALEKTWLWKGMVENKDTIFKVLDLRRKYNDGKTLTDEEKKEVNSLIETEKFKEFLEKIKTSPEGLPNFRTLSGPSGDSKVFDLPEFIDCFDNLDKGARKFGYKDIYELIEKRR